MIIYIYLLLIMPQYTFKIIIKRDTSPKYELWCVPDMTASAHSNINYFLCDAESFSKILDSFNCTEDELLGQSFISYEYNFHDAMNKILYPPIVYNNIMDDWLVPTLISMDFVQDDQQNISKKDFFKFIDKEFNPSFVEKLNLKLIEKTDGLVYATEDNIVYNDIANTDLSKIYFTVHKKGEFHEQIMRMAFINAYYPFSRRDFCFK